MIGRGYLVLFPRILRGLVLAVSGVGLVACVNAIPYGYATQAELEPLAEGWSPNLAVRNPRDWNSGYDQYRWVSSSGVQVSVGSAGYTDETQIVVEFRNRGTASVYLGVAAQEWGGIYAEGGTASSGFYRLEPAGTVRIDPGRYREFWLHGIPWLGDPHVGDRFAMQFEIRCGDSVEVCPCAFAVNHLRQHE